MTTTDDEYDGFGPAEPRRYYAARADFLGRDILLEADGTTSDAEVIPSAE